MEPILTTIIAAFVAGAVAKAKDVGSEVVTDAYNGLKSLTIRKLGKGGAVQSVEDEPESEPAQATLAEALAKKGLQADEEIKALAERLERAIADAKAAAVPGVSDIEIVTVHGAVIATVEKLVAAGRITLGPVVAEAGDATVRDLSAGVDPKQAGANPRNR